MLIHGLHTRSGIGNSTFSPQLRVSESSFIISIASLYAATFLLATVCITVRCCRHATFGSSDGFLLIASAALSASVGMSLAFGNRLYDLVRGLAGASRSQTATPVFGNIIISGQILPQITVYAVKLGLMVILWQAIQSDKQVRRMWCAVVTLLVATFLTSLGLSIFAEIYVSTLSAENSTFSTSFSLPTYIEATVTLDAVTNVLILGPVIVLSRKPHARPIGKLTLAIIICLNVFLIAMAIVRGALAKYLLGSSNHGSRQDNFSIDWAWVSFWQIVEADAAVLGLSLAVFSASLRTLKCTADDRVHPERELIAREQKHSTGASSESEGDAGFNLHLQETDATTSIQTAYHLAYSFDYKAPSCISPTDVDDARDSWSQRRPSQSLLSRKTSHLSPPQSPGGRSISNVSSSSKHQSRLERLRTLRGNLSAEDTQRSPNTTSWSWHERRWPRITRHKSPHWGSPRHLSIYQDPTGDSGANDNGTADGQDRLSFGTDLASAVWASPSPIASLRSLPRRQADQEQLVQRSIDRRQVVEIDIDDEEESMRIEEARQAREDQTRWLALQKKFEAEKLLPPPVARPPPQRIMRMDALVRNDDGPTNSRTKAMPGGMF